MQWDNNRTNFDRNLAVVIGIDRYDSRGIHDLQTAVSDANAIANLLRDEYGYKDEHIVRLFSPKNDEATLKALHQPYVQLHSKNSGYYSLTPSRITLNQPRQTVCSFTLQVMGFLATVRMVRQAIWFLRLPNKGNPDSFLSMRELHDALSKLECHHLLVILTVALQVHFAGQAAEKPFPF
jgi:hypothetical protein